MSKIKEVRREAIAYLSITLFLWLIGILTPYISGLYIDFLITEISFKLLIWFVVVIAVIGSLQMFCRYFMSVASTKFNQKLVASISSNIYQKIFNSRYSEYTNVDNAYYIDQINKDTSTLVTFFSANILSFFFQIATIIISAIIVLRADKLLCMIVFSVIPVYIITFLWNQKGLYISRRIQKEKSNEFFSRCSEQINKFEYIKRNTLNIEMKSRFQEAFDKMMGSSIHAIKVSYVFTNLNQFVVLLIYVCIVGIGGYKVSTGSLSVGFFSIINTYFNMIISSISYFIGLAGSYQDAKISFQRIEKILKSPDEEKGEQGINSIQKVECKDFSLRHGSHMLLDHCSITFYRGRIYGLYGQNGTGKTTFLNALIGLFSGETSGIVSYNGIAIDRLNMPLLRRQKISYVEQTPVMLNMPVKAFLNFGIEQSQSVAETQKMLIEMLEIDGLLTKDINENGSNLSGGEKQKLSIVRALSKESFLILLDEPTSALDKDSIEKLMTLLKQRKTQAIILLVSHDQKVLEQCDEVIDISDLRGN